MRQWFVDNDFIEGVIYLPENLFYNTTAPGIILFLNKKKPAARKNKIFLVNASREFEKGDPKNYITDDGIVRIAETFKEWREEEKFSRIVSKEDVVKNDYNISPSRYIHAAEGEEYRTLKEIIEDLSIVESEVKETNSYLYKLLNRLGA